MKLTIFAISVCSILLVICGMALAEALKPIMMPPVKIEFIRLPPKTIEVEPVYIYTTVYEYRIVDHYPAPEIRTVERRLMPKWFESEEELYQWYEDNSPAWLTPNGFGARPECDDYAEEMMERGFRTGRLLLPCPVWNGKVMGERVIDGYREHAGCWTWIGNDIYYIEPQPCANPIVKLKIKRDIEYK